MNFLAGFRQIYSKFLIVGVLCASAGFAIGILANDKKQMIVIPFEEAKFVAIAPAQPDGPQMAVLSGDPAKGSSAILLKFQKSAGRLHYHTSDYHLVLLKGTMKHWAAGEKESEAKVLEPGSYWFQPGNQAHADSCLTDECLMFINWADKRDAKLAETSE